jgi:hypothetical protein
LWITGQKAIFSQLRTPVAQEVTGSENFLLKKQEFAVLHCRPVFQGLRYPFSQRDKPRTTDNGQLTTDSFYSILAHLKNRAEVIGAARGNPGLQVFAEFSPRHLVHFLSFNFHEVPPITNRALDGHLGTMFHKLVL